MGHEEKLKILSVDDNETNRYTMRRILERQGYEVIDATSGEEAFEKLELNPDLVILDVSLPDMSGFDICRKIKEKYSSLPVLQVSASFIQNKDRVEGLESGADAYLAQPVDASVILATVRSSIRVRRAEREKETLIKELQKERSVTERFIATLTHDLRNPLSNAKISAQLLERSPLLEAKEKNLAAKIIKNINRTDLMIQDLLDASMLRAGGKLPVTMQSTNLVSLTETIIEEFKAVHGSRIQLVINGPIPEGYWNGDNLGRVLENLITNAVKYGSTDLPIIVTLAHPVNEKFVKISVLNYGNPIPVDQQARLFNEFERLESAVASQAKGWGLGLTLVQGVADSHAGFTSISSSEEHGTEFAILIPVDHRTISV